jgi:DNA-binding transcriptional ArsR family regulator
MKTRLRHPYSRFFGTLSNQIRIDTMMLLLKGPKNVTQISEALKMKQPTISKNLSRLEECGFVMVRQEGKERIYMLNEDTTKKIMLIMDKHMKQYCSPIQSKLPRGEHHATHFAY